MSIPKPVLADNPCERASRTHTARQSRSSTVNAERETSTGNDAPPGLWAKRRAGKAAGFADTATRKETGTVGLEGEPLSLTLSKDGKYAFSGVQAQGKIHVIDVAQRKIIRTITTPKDAGPDPALPLE